MVVNNNSIHSQLPKFTGKNFDNWCIQMRVLFRSQDLWDLINIDYNKVIDSKEFKALSREQKGSLKDFRKKDKKTLYAIFQVVDESIFEKILEAETTKESWVTLQKLYKGDKCVK
ncbi:hypothetical protein PVL29_018879 [Vitis rotundifolia]|uniref:DUF4219 domain-containing protein n=1 Tax=Vitis rotundifolia TaxID=103349 RepID=A0AA38Z6A5_VITRO|nr:hypothetical protein PVL29_018879 [Vitis rotundifolia]